MFALIFDSISIEGILKWRIKLLHSLLKRRYRVCDRWNDGEIQILINNSHSFRPLHTSITLTLCLPCQFVCFYVRFYSIKLNYKFQMQRFPWYLYFTWLLLRIPSYWCILLLMLLFLSRLFGFSRFRCFYVFVHGVHSLQSEKFSSTLLNFPMRSCSMHVQYDFIMFCSRPDSNQVCLCARCIGTNVTIPAQICVFVHECCVRQCWNTHVF